MIKTLSILAILLLSMLGVTGDYFIKLAGRNPGGMESKWFFLGTALYASTAVGWFYVMREIKLSTLGVFYAVFTVLCLVAVSVIIFHEQLRVLEIAGIGGALVSLIILGRFL